MCVRVHVSVFVRGEMSGSSPLETQSPRPPLHSCRGFVPTCTCDGVRTVEILAATISHLVRGSCWNEDGVTDSLSYCPTLHSVLLL